MKKNYTTYGFKEVKPSELELRGYLYQFCSYTGKRSFVQGSYEVANYLESKGIELYSLSEIPVDTICKILKKFKVFPKILYYHKGDQYSNYNSAGFIKSTEKKLFEENRNIFGDDEIPDDIWTEIHKIIDEKKELREKLLFLQDGLMYIIKNYLSKNVQKKLDEYRKPQIQKRVDAEIYNIYKFMPIFYESIQEVSLHYGKILIAYSVGGNIIDIFSETGKKLLIDEFKFDSWRESDSFTSCTIAHDKKSILIHFLGRIPPSWAIFEYSDQSFHFLKSECSFGQDNSPANYYFPNEIDAVYKMGIVQKEQLQSMTSPVIIDGQEWTTKNLETPYLQNGDPIIEASTNEEWEAAGFNKSLYKHLEGIDLEALYRFCKSESFEVIVSGYLPTEGNSQEKADAITAFISEKVTQDSSAIAKQGEIEYLVLDLDFLNYALQYFKEFVEIKEWHELLYILKKAIYNNNETNYWDNRIYLQTGFFDVNVFGNNEARRINVRCFLDSVFWASYVFSNFKRNKNVDDCPFGHFIKFTSLKLLQDKVTIRKAVSSCPDILEFVSDKLKDDIDVVLSAINSVSSFDEEGEILSGWVLEYASNRLKDNKEVVLAAISNDEYALRYASDRLKDDKEIVLASVRSHGNSLKFASQRLQDDKEVVVVAVSEFLSGTSLRFASERLRDDKEVVVAAISTEAEALEFASERLKDDSEIILSAVNCIEYVHHEYYEEYGKSGWAIQFASERLKDDKEVVLEAVKIDGMALEFVSERLKDDEEVVLAAVTNDASALKYASDRLKIKHGYFEKKDNKADDLPF